MGFIVDKQVGGMREPVVLIPGLLCDYRLYLDQIHGLGRDRAITVAPVTQGERMEEIASDLLMQLPAKFALVGYSFGGGVAMELIRRAPERITRLALISTSPLADTPQQSAEREQYIVKARAGRMEEAVRELMRPDYLAPGPGRLEAMNAYLRMAMDQGPEVLTRQLRALQRRRDQQATLRKIKVPTLVMCGVHDGLTPAKRHEFMAELIPTSRLVLLERAGHLAPMEQPGDVTQELRDWLLQPEMV